MSRLENELLYQMRLAGLPEPEREIKGIVPNRRYRFDFGWPSRMILVEINGDVWRKSGHTSGVGINRDTEKCNLATLEGWKVLTVTSNQIHDGRALLWLRRAIERPIDSPSPDATL
jgi:very-short-patch-repair endonuclease